MIGCGKGIGANPTGNAEAMSRLRLNICRAGIAWSDSSVLSAGEIGSRSSPSAKERA